MKNHQMGNQRKGRAPSIMIISLQPYAPNNHPVSGADPATASGWQRHQYALARARSEQGNQFARSTSVAGKTPLSAMPSRKRISSNCRTVRDNPQTTAQSPQQTSKRLITFLPLQRDD